MASNIEISSSEAEQQDLVAHLRLRLNASGLPRQRGVLKNRNPSTYAIVTSISGGHGGQTVPERIERSNTQLEGFKWGQTEVVYHSQNPQWIETINVSYEYGTELYFYVHIMQSEGSESGNVSCQTLSQALFANTLGTALFEVGDIMGSRKSTKSKRLRAGGNVFCRIENIQVTGRVLFQLGARDLVLPHGHRRSWTGNMFHRNPDIVFEIETRRASDSLHEWVVVYRSQSAVNTLAPIWDAVELDTGMLCNGDLDKYLRICIKTVRSSGQRELIGLLESKFRPTVMPDFSHRSCHPTDFLYV
jgi:hypothetical protein